MRPGLKPFNPDNPWKNVHENFTNRNKANTSWSLNHFDAGGVDDRALYNRATANLQWIIGDAVDRHTLRAIGANWSLSRVAMCDGGMVQTKGLDLIFEVPRSHVAAGYNAASGKTHDDLRFVECGVQIARLNENLEIDNDPPRSIIASGGSNGQTIAGATSTGTHGAALFTGAVHDSIVGIHLVTGADTHVWLERELYPVASDEFLALIGAEPKRSDELFNAALVSFGSFGIIHGIMLETEPLYLLKEYRIEDFTYSDELMKAMADLDIDELRRLLQPHMPESKPGHELYHMEINMNPYTVKKGEKGGMFIFLFYKVPVPPGHVVNHGGSNPPGPVTEFIWMMKNLLGALGGLGHLGYDIIKSKTTDEFVKNIRQPTPEPKSIGAIFRDTRFTGNIASFALAVDTADLARAIEQILAEIAHNAFAGAVAVRFVKGTKATLGFTKFDHTCVIEMDGLDSPDNHDVFTNVVNRLRDNQIPYTIHWGKLNDPMDATRVAQMYEPWRIRKWKESREALLSPKARAVFTNPFMVKCGLDTPAAPAAGVPANVIV